MIAADTVSEEESGRQFAGERRFSREGKAVL